MSQTAVFWDSEMMFHKVVEEAAGPVEAVSPLMLAAPFFRGSFAGIIIPTGFGNVQYSRMLPALRACASRIEEYLEAGGKMLVFGAADAGPSRYDWLPVEVSYHFEFMEHATETDTSSPWGCLADGYNMEKLPCDGWFEKSDGKAVITSKTVNAPVLCEWHIGDGTLLLAGVHEYPSTAFLREFAKGEPVSF